MSNYVHAPVQPVYLKTELFLGKKVVVNDYRVPSWKHYYQQLFAIGFLMLNAKKVHSYF